MTKARPGWHKPQKPVPAPEPLPIDDYPPVGALSEATLMHGYGALERTETAATDTSWTKIPGAGQWAGEPVSEGRTVRPEGEKR